MSSDARTFSLPFFELKIKNSKRTNKEEIPKFNSLNYLMESLPYELTLSENLLVLFQHYASVCKCKSECICFEIYRMTKRS